MAQEPVKRQENSKIDADTNEKRRILFVGGLPGLVDEELLKDYFSKLTSVTNLKIARDKKSKASKGYAYVTLAESSVIPAIVGTHHYLHGRKLDVQVASRKGERHIWKNEQRKRRLFLIDLPCNITTQEFEEAFSRFGRLHNAYTVIESGDCEENRYGYVEFEKPESAERALSAKVYILGKLVQLSKFRNQEQTSGQDSGILSVHPVQTVSMGQTKILVLEPKNCCLNQLKNSASRTSIGTKSELKISGAGSPREDLYPTVTSTFRQLHPIPSGALITEGSLAASSKRAESSHRMGLILQQPLNQSPSNYRLNVLSARRAARPLMLSSAGLGNNRKPRAVGQPSKLPAGFCLFPASTKTVSSAVQPRLSAAIGKLVAPPSA